MEKSGLIIYQLPRSKGWGISLPIEAIVHSVAWPHSSPHPHL